VAGRAQDRLLRFARREIRELLGADAALLRRGMLDGVEAEICVWYATPWGAAKIAGYVRNQARAAVDRASQAEALAGLERERAFRRQHQLQDAERMAALDAAIAALKGLRKTRHYGDVVMPLRLGLTRRSRSYSVHARLIADQLLLLWRRLDAAALRSARPRLGEDELRRVSTFLGGLFAAFGDFEGGRHGQSLPSELTVRWVLRQHFSNGNG
jgi:hypothetical protein